MLKAALEKDPKYAEAYRLMGIAQLQMKKDKEACASFAKAKELGDPLSLIHIYKWLRNYAARYL